MLKIACSFHQFLSGNKFLEKKPFSYLTLLNTEKY